MSRSRMRMGIAMAGLAGAAASAPLAQGQPTISLVPVGTGPHGALGPYETINGNEITLRRVASETSRVFLEVRVGDWDPNDTGVQLKAFEVTVSPAGLASGLQGALTAAQAYCTENQDCVNAFGGICSIFGGTCQQDPDCFFFISSCLAATCGLGCLGANSCEPAFTYWGHSDDVFRNLSHDRLAAPPCPALWFGRTTILGPADELEPFPADGAYAGTLVLDVPADVEGTFTLDLLPSGTYLMDGNDQPIPVGELVPAKITVHQCGAADCNANGIGDACDIADGTSLDCDGNGVPDECEPDCNGNGVVDGCDIRWHGSEDCNANGVPDECDISAGTSLDDNTNGWPDECDGGPTMAWLPVGTGPHGEVDPSVHINGHDVTIYADGARATMPLHLEIRVGNWDPNGEGILLKAYEADLDTSIFTGEADALRPLQMPCTSDWDCIRTLGGICTITGGECSEVSACLLGYIEACGGPVCGYPEHPYACEPGWYYFGHPDILHLIGIGGDIAAVDLTGFRYASADSDGAGISPPIPFPDSGLYGGTLLLEVPLVIEQEFTVQFLPPRSSVLIDTQNRFIPLGGFVPATIRVVQCGAADCNGNGVGDNCDLDRGTSFDCNGNLVPDECDLSSGLSADCDGNGRPDTCDLADGSADDCNANAVPDSCDLSGGVSVDCNANLIPDACDIDGGGSADCDRDGVPDDCETDCNGNGAADDCEVDSDGDGVINACDGCAFDPDKTTAGVCGCGVSDVDSDGDTLADCIDLCPGEDDRVDINGNGEPDCTEGIGIPAVSAWGMTALALLLLVGAKVRLWRERFEPRLTNSR